MRPRHLLLLGGGHAHLHVLRDFATARPPGIRITLVSPSAALTYSGMVPGVVAGRYRIDEARIALEPLARRAQIDFLPGAAVAIDAAVRRVTVARTDDSDEVVDYDLLSVDVGGAMPRDAIAGAAEHALFVRPIERFLDALESRLGRSPSGAVAHPRSSASAGLTGAIVHPWSSGSAGPASAVVIGGGAGGFELALALRARLPVTAGIALVSGGPLLASHSVALRGRARRALERRDVVLHEDTCTRIGRDQVVLASGASIACDLAIVATGSVAPTWLRASGLALDREGFIATGPTLQSLSHGEVFAAGDVATRADAHRPRNGVHAVRAGPPLARNLRLAIDGRPCRPYRLQRRSLSLLACGDGVAIAEWGRWSIAGRAIGRLKDRIDRDFVALNRAA